MKACFYWLLTLDNVEILADTTYLIFTPVDEVSFLELQFCSHLPNTQFTLVRNYGVSQVTLPVHCV